MTPLPVAAPASRVVEVGEVVHTLGITKATVYALLRAGKIPASRVGLKFFIPRAWLDAVLAGEDPGERLESTDPGAEALLSRLDTFRGPAKDLT